jgi:hypothetical protein
MNAVTTQETVSAQTLEHVLGTGDLSKLTTGQRVEFMARTCQSLGLNPLTRPFRFLQLNGQIQMYATRDCTDQLRKLHKINLAVIDKQQDGDVYIVTVRARTPDGREDEDIGAVTLGQLQGDGRANALMKCLTKAKRRVTLSICGLGLLSEDELDTLPGAAVFDADERPPVQTRREQINSEVPLEQQPGVQKMTLRQWLDDFELRCQRAETEEQANAILNEERVLRLDDPALVINESARQRALAARKAMVNRIWAEPPNEDEDESALDPESVPA